MQKIWIFIKKRIENLLILSFASILGFICSILLDNFLAFLFKTQPFLVPLF